MNAIKKNGSKVDLIALHHDAADFAVDVAVANFQSYIQSVYGMYKLLISVTEFAMVNYTTPTDWTTPDAPTQVIYCTAAGTMLEGLDYVERYAWSAVPQNYKQPATNLADASGALTSVGHSYKAI